MKSADKVLIIDDDEIVGALVSTAARGMGLECITVRESAEFFNLAVIDSGATLILLDLVMPGMDGIEVLRLLGERHCKSRIVLMSGMNKRVIETATKLARSLGLSVVGCLQKPFSLEELKDILGTIPVAETQVTAIEGPPIPIPDEQLHDAFDRGEFVNYYQPQISIATGEVTGVEALSRWLHPRRGLLLPVHFISHAESLGLMDRLYWITAELAMAEVPQFTARNGILPRLSLNASVYTLRDLQFPDTFMKLARKHDFPTEKIAIEITETGLINELSHTLDVLTRLRMKQVQLSIDDFGTGYAMMQQLQNIPATELKIDRSLVQNMHANDSDRVMVEKVIEMGHELDMEVIAEGVMTRDQLDLLRAMGCDGAQGFFFSHPIPATEMTAWLAAYSPAQALQ